MTFQTLLYSVENRIATVTINRPDKLNALNATSKAELVEVFSALKADPAIDVVIITGAGDKAFVAGTDIGELSQLNRITGREFAAEGQRVFNLIENLDKPVIAAVNGYALGGGCELAIACHLRIASDKAKFGQPEVNLGIIPGYGGTQRLARLVGKGRAIEMILTGAQVDAEEALRIGLVNKVVPHKDLVARTQAMAQLIAGMGQVAVRMGLKAVQATGAPHLKEGLDQEALLFGDCCETDDFREGIKAFLEKRKPNFKHA